jgi:hypothetical protein
VRNRRQKAGKRQKAKGREEVSGARRSKVSDGRQAAFENHPFLPEVS